MGLINGITPAGEVIATALMKARQLAERPAASLLVTKSLLKRAHARLVEETIDDELTRFRRAADFAGGGGSLSGVLRAPQARLLEVRLTARHRPERR